MARVYLSKTVTKKSRNIPLWLGSIIWVRILSRGKGRMELENEKKQMLFISPLCPRVREILYVVSFGEMVFFTLNTYNRWLRRRKVCKEKSLSFFFWGSYFSFPPAMVTKIQILIDLEPLCQYKAYSLPPRKLCWYKT